MKEKIEGLKQILYVLLPMFVFVILYDVCTAIFQYLSTLILGSMGTTGAMWISDKQGTVKALCIMGGLFMSFLCLLKLAVTDGFLTPKKELWKKPIWQYLVVFIGTGVIAYGFNYLFTVTGFAAKSENYQVVAENQYDVVLVVGLILYGAVSPFVEEVIFRGFLYGRMRVYMKKVWAVLLSSLLFGIYHGNLVQGVYGFFMGLIFALVYNYYNNFYMAVFMHMIANLVGYYIQLNGFI